MIGVCEHCNAHYVMIFHKSGYGWLCQACVNTIVENFGLKPMFYKRLGVFGNRFFVVSKNGFGLGFSCSLFGIYVGYQHPIYELKLVAYKKGHRALDPNIYKTLKIWRKKRDKFCMICHISMAGQESYLESFCKDCIVDLESV